MSPRRTLVVGVGNPERGDDGVGPRVAAEVAARRLPGVAVVAPLLDPSRLADLWDGYERVVVIDAAWSGAAPGTMHRIDLAACDVPAGVSSASSHGWGVAECVALARCLGTLPPRIVAIAVEGAGFDHGAGLDAAVERAVPAALAAVLAELGTFSEPRFRGRLDKP